MCISLQAGYWIALPLVLPAAGFLVRLFIIQHDCGHGSFFPHKTLNDWTGRILGVLTFTPYDWWKRTHALHHASSGNLARRGIGDVDTLTVEEYLALPKMRRLAYRIYRNPFVLFVLGPSYLFLLQHRLPVGLMGRDWKPWASAMATNLGILLLAVAMVWLFGLKTLLFVHLPIVVLAGTFGVWLFYVQHQFEHTVWAQEPEWDRHGAALHGSSYYDLPEPLQWITGYIGIHHVHHLCSKIPFYRLPTVLKAYPQLREISRLSVTESLKCVRLALWDEKRKRLIGFSDLSRPSTGA